MYSWPACRSGGHYIPLKAGICSLPEGYKYSSARFHETGIDDWGFAAHYNE